MNYMWLKESLLYQGNLDKSNTFSGTNKPMELSNQVVNTCSTRIPSAFIDLQFYVLFYAWAATVISGTMFSNGQLGTSKTIFHFPPQYFRTHLYEKPELWMVNHLRSMDMAGRLNRFKNHAYRRTFKDKNEQSRGTISEVGLLHFPDRLRNGGGV